ncbi:hypothetical protein C9374_013048 [Naegleria lovaniensis]|uniref:Uncharacterized protein n=1 Tax=Naegleria lovaniensis TaxID=51637 RepID=A0AA88GA63_NAELO|nr:uncharacterized protein C9374_013048 [Naegleria lovaniensis]KAG2372926.1 hypothetical protein C9374_013048 [Naegleria lovaniensis]
MLLVRKIFRTLFHSSSSFSSSSKPLHSLFQQYLCDDVLRIILSFLSIHDFTTLQLVSFRLSQLACEDCCWKDYYFQRMEIFKYEMKLLRLYCVPHEDRNHDVIPNYFSDQCQMSSNFRYHLIELMKHVESCTHRQMKEFESTIMVSYKDMIPKFCNLCQFYSSHELKQQFEFSNLMNSLKTMDEKLLFRVAVIGDKRAGKSSFVDPHGKFGVFTLTTGQVKIQYQDATFQMLDIPGLKFLARTAVCTNAHLICLCFNVLDENNVKDLYQWISDLQEKRKPQIPIILVACKTDLRSRKDICRGLRMKHFWEPLSSKMGESLARALGCVTYIETSAFCNQGFEDLGEIFAKALVAHNYDRIGTMNKKLM